MLPVYKRLTHLQNPSSLRKVFAVRKLFFQLSAQSFSFVKVWFIANFSDYYCLSYAFLISDKPSVVDALGKPPSGFLNGNTVLMGSYDTCKAMIKSAEYGANYKPCKIKAVMTLVIII